MSNPPTEIRRGWGWETDQWQRFEPRLRGMAEIADEGLEHFGISYPEPITCTVQRIAQRRKLPYAGQSLDNNNQLLIQIDPAAAYPTPAQYEAWSITMFHEGIHTGRSSQFGYYGEVVEAVVTEGLAYYSERLQAAKTCGEQALSNLAKLSYLPTDEDLERFFTLKRLTGKLDNHGWLNKKSGGVTVVGQIGVHIVKQRISEGATIPELIKTPAREVIGL